jgi:biopolymer transport protein ExbB
MNLLSILLQVSSTAATLPTEVPTENYFHLLFKGGWILLPLFLLFVLTNYIIIERWVTINILGKNDKIWLGRINEFVVERKIEKAIRSCNEHPTSYAKVLGVALELVDRDDVEIQEAMQSEARQQISILEKSLNYLSITASIAPMLGFLGTIFGVIKIFYNISLTNDLNIANISDGLYQKMISSGTGLFVGIIAYAGYYILNSRIDKIVVRTDKYSNDLLRLIRDYKREKTV